MVWFGQCVIGPPGSGKTTYTAAMAEYLEGKGRKFAIINLDPANEDLPYKAAVDLSELIRVTDVMETFKLGPNGALIYCIEYLETNLDWLQTKLKELSSDTYLLIDCPGQVELYTHHSSVRNILQTLQYEDIRLTAVHLVDGVYCADPAKYIAILLTSLSAMINIEMPHVNVLTKFDLVDSAALLFDTEYYTGVMDLEKLCEVMGEDRFLARHRGLSRAIAGVIEDYALVNFHPLNVKDKKSLRRILAETDKANGWMFGQATERIAQEHAAGPRMG
ncbi:GPN-loop GTPase 2-like [Tropilaelaps mercedesae]|uniref:GPN-loop GTPase 2 n=1 Tax=Tropilaelaps mercedesae TaxID=418985 RepID=A0A1V9X176_9ACAR|nr:GPN-loop GTPase 2-like [Tropilaelaps mercedesae]